MGSNVRNLAKALRVLGSESGMRIFIILSKNKNMCVSDISGRIGLSISATSHKLQQMEASGFVKSFRDGRTICYLFRDTKTNRELSKIVSMDFDK